MPTYAAPGVYVEEVPSSQKVLTAAATAIAAFVGFTGSYPDDDPTDPQGVKPRLVTSWTQFEQNYGGFAEGCMLPIAVRGYFDNGGTIAYVVRIPNTAPSGQPAQLALPAADNALGTPLEITTVEPDANVSVAVSKAEADGQDGPNPFNLIVLEGDTPVESFENLTITPGDRNVETVVNAASTKVKVKVNLDKKVDLSSMIDVMKPGTFALAKQPGTPVAVNGRAFAGSESTRTGIDGLAIAEDVTMVIVPDLITAATKPDKTVDLAMWKAVQTSLITHCELHGNRMAILDAPPGMSPQQIRDWRGNQAMYDSAFAALYYPWIRVENPNSANGSDSEILIPPSGHIAGVWARVDESRGVWKAPANETIAGCLDVEYPVTKAEQSLLNPTGINCIRPFGTRGIRIWGGRTLSSDTDWRYLNVRRLFNMVETTILDGTQWAVFEPNDMKLWEGVKRTLTGFLTGLWREGALFGTSPDQAFFVKCDAETNPPQSIDEGKLVVEVGIAPVKPAEFVIFRISQQKQSAS